MDNHERTDARHWRQALSLGREGRAGAPHDGMTGRGAGLFGEGRDPSGAEEKYPCSMRYGLAFLAGKM